MSPSLRNSLPAIAALSLLGCWAAPAYALQGLCSNSPENPTAILGLLGAAAASYPYARERARRLLARRRDTETRD